MNPIIRQEADLLSVKEVSCRLSLGRTKLYELIKSGKIKSLKVGSRRLIPFNAIKSFVASLGLDAQA